MTQPLAAYLAGSLVRGAPSAPPRPAAVPWDGTALRPGVVPLVLLPAFPLHAGMFEDMSLNLGAIPLVLLDLPGQGRSSVQEPASIETAARAVMATLEAMGVGRSVVGGVSMGGYVTLALMRLAPEALAGVILMHTKADADSAEARQRRLAVAQQVLAEASPASLTTMADDMVSAATKTAHPDRVEQVRRWISQASPAGVAWAQTAMAGRPDTWQTLRVTGLPMSVWAGSEDPFAPVEAAEAMVAATGGQANRLVVISDVAHLSPVESPVLAATLAREAYHRMVQAL